MTTDLDSLPEHIELNSISDDSSADIPKEKEIDISFFSHRNRKSTRLVGNDSEKNYIKARREWMDFNFVELIFVTDIEVFAEGYKHYHELELSYTEMGSGEAKTIKARYDDDGSYRFVVNRFIGGFGLRPTTSLWKDSKLTKIELFGVEQEYFGEVVSLFSNVNQERKRIELDLDKHLERAKVADSEYQMHVSQIADAKEEITALHEQLSDYESTTNNVKEKLDKLREDTAISESVKRDVDQKTEIASNNVEMLKRDAQSLNRKISEHQNELRSLEADINLFPTEISGYVTQGATNVKLYAWLCLVPLAVIVIVTFRLFENSQQLLNYVHNPDISIFEFLVSRAPYVAVSAIILAVAYTILHRLVTEIIGINRRRQDLFKVSIIATDVSNASLVDLSLSDRDAYDLRTETKMELLKEHLRQHIGEEYKYTPKSSLVHKLSTKLASNIADDEASEKSG